MTNEQNAQVDDLFNQLCEAEATERASILSAVEDPQVRDEVLSLLRHVGPSGESIETSVGAMMRAASLSGAFADRAIGPGTRFERYRIQHKLGQGGMGDVYSAVRENDFHKLVALKIVRYGLDSEFARGRFQQERQTLAGLEHPFIARLLDGGEAENGCPYLVLEFVDGAPIDVYCQGRTRNEVLRLFLKVCEAVEYAHRNLVIHRDLKPANILVTADGDPKLLDFGIAKLLDGSADATQTIMAALTPQYASPEQILGQPITTASDVYSLGIVLYQLLTGRKPYQIETTTAMELERVVCHDAPLPPAIGDELDHILLMALRKEPERRYASVLQFAQDVERYMDGRPVLAAPDTFGYRARKFIGLHKIAIGAVGMVILVLAGGLVSTLYQMRRAERERRLAERRFQDVRSLANTMLFELHDRIRSLPGSAGARELLVTTSLHYLDQLSTEAGSDKALLSELQSAYARTGDVQGDPTGQSLGKTGAAMKSYLRSVEIGETLRAGGDDSVGVLDTLAIVYYRIGSIQLDAGKAQESAATMRKGLRISEEMRGKSDQAYYQTVRCYLGLAHALRSEGDPQAATESTAKALAAEIEGDTAHPNDQAPRAIAVIRTQLGNDLASLGKLPAALEQFTLATQIAAPLLSKEHELRSYDRFQRSLAFAYGGAGMVSGDPNEPNLANPTAGNAYNSKMVALLEAVQRDEPKDLSARRNLVEAYDDAASTMTLNDPAAALALCRQALAMAEELSAADPHDSAKLIGLASAEFSTGRVLIGQGKRAGALPHLKRSLEIQRTVPSADTVEIELRRLLSNTLVLIGEPESLSEGLKVAEALWAVNSHDLRAALTLAVAYEGMGDAAARVHNWSEASGWYARSRDLWKDWPQHGFSSSFDVEQARHAARLLAQSEAHRTS